jgi:ribose 5-phosphate isomerase B
MKDRKDNTQSNGSNNTNSLKSSKAAGSIFSKTILLASDHAGFKLKNFVRDFLLAQGYTVEDLGAYEFDADDNYPELIMPLAMRIAENPEKYNGIIFGKSGQGEAIVANRFPAVRAIVYYGDGKRPHGKNSHSENQYSENPYSENPNNENSHSENSRSEGEDIVTLGREHNDSNVLSLGADFLSYEEAQSAVQLWLATPFSGEDRHQRRIDMIDQMS